jgi:hypothetical protein
MKQTALRLIVLAAVFVGAMAPRAHGQASVGGEVATTLRNTKISDYSNRTYRYFSNFDTMRARLYFDAQVTDHVSVFTQVLIDTQVFQLYGAYVRLEQLAGPYLNLQVGLIPAPVGAWDERTYQMTNPLIGTPLPYSYHSALVPGGPDSMRTVDDMWESAEDRSNYGLPVIYDACWNTGGEFYGATGKLDYSIGFLTGSLSLPTTQSNKERPQGTVHLAYNFGPGLRIGGSGWYGTYLTEGSFNDSLPTGASLNDYQNAGAGYELYLAHRMLEIHSEGFFSYWEHPYLPRLDVLSGYAELKYTVLAGWYVAGRFDWYLPGLVTNAAGVTKSWDYDVERYEFGLGYKPGRSTVIKLVAQLNRIPDESELNHDLVALQVVVGY